MKFNGWAVGLMLLFVSVSGGMILAAQDTTEAAEKPLENTFETWVRENAGPWMACTVLGTNHYVRYLLDRDNWLHFKFFSEFLEIGDCFYRDLEWAADIYREGAKAGRDVHALYLGHLYLKGLGVKRDVEEARRWFDLGVLYYIDTPRKYQIDHTKLLMGHRGMPTELVEAIDRGRKKFLGDGRDLLSIAQNLRFGNDGMTRNRDAARKLYSIADRAILSFTRQYRPREPGFTNFQEGFQHYRTRLERAYQVRGRENTKYEIYISMKQIYEFAASDDHGPSQKFIANAFRGGKHVERNYFVAYVFYRAAQNNGLEVSDRIKQTRPRLTSAQIAEAEDDIRQGKFQWYNYLAIRKAELPRKPELITKRVASRTKRTGSVIPNFKDFQEKFQYYKQYYYTTLKNSAPLHETERSKWEVYFAIHQIYDMAAIGEHAPSQKIVGDMFETGKLVERDWFAAYVFYGSAQMNGLAVADDIERIRPHLTPEQISEAKNDIRERKVFRNYHYRGIRKKLPKLP